MRGKLIGLALLAFAVAFCWADVAIGQARAGEWIVRAIGPTRVAKDPALVETLFTLLIYLPLIVGGVIAAAAERRNAVALGIRPLRGFAVGLAAGTVGLSVTVGFARLAGVLTFGEPAVAASVTLLWGATIVMLQVVAEEVFFRGWLQPALVRRWGWWPGIVAGAVAFAALHVAGGARSPVSLLNLFAGGLMFGLFAAQGRGIAAALGAHWAWNVGEQLVWGLDPNPGLGGFGAVWDFDLVGRAIWGGSADGLNGGIGMTLALLAILLPLWASGQAGARALSPSNSPGFGRSGRVPS